MDESLIGASVDEYIKNKSTLEKEQLKASLGLAVDYNPDQEAKFINMARDSGLPLETVRNQPDDARRMIELNKFNFDNMYKQDSVLAKAYSNPEFASIGYDDYENTSLVSKAVRGLGMAKDLVVATGKKASAGVVGLAEIPFELAGQGIEATGILPENPFARPVASMEEYRKWIKSSAEAQMPQAESDIGKGLISGFSSLTQNIAAMPLLFLPGGQAAFLAQMVAPLVGEEYAKAREKGISPAGATAYGAGQGYVEYWTEKFPLMKLVSDLKVGSPLFKTIINQAKTEVPREQLATLLQDLNEWSVLNPDSPFIDYVKERPSAALQTLIATVVGVGGQTTVATGLQKTIDKITGETERAERAKIAGDIVEKLGNLMSANKIRARDPQAIQDFIQQVTDESDVQDFFISANVLKQTGLLEQVVELIPEVGVQLSKLVSPDAEISIPISEFATKLGPTEVGAALLDDIRVEGETMTRREALDFIEKEAESLEKAYGEVMGTEVAAQEFKKSARAVEKNFEQQFKDLGIFTPADTKVHAALYSRVFSMLALRLNQTPEQVYEKYKTTIAAEGQVNVGQALNQDNWSNIGKQGDMFAGELADKDTQVDTGIVISSKGDTLKGGNVNNQGRQITGTKQGLSNFWNWFGNSAAAEKGKPMVVYHTTRSDVFKFETMRESENSDNLGGTWKVWRSGIFFTPNLDYSQSYGSYGGKYEPGANVMPVYLSIQNPIDFRQYAKYRDELAAALEAKGLNANYASSAATDWELFDNYEDSDFGQKFVETLKELGYDGAIITEQNADGEDVPVYVAFDPEQIKSVTGNIGTFDPNNPNILMQRGAQAVGKPVPESVDAVSNVVAAFNHAAGQTFKTNRDFKLDIQNRVLAAAKAAKVDLSEFTQGVEEYLVRVALADSMTALETNPNAVGWYNEKVTKALRIVSLIHPEIATDPQAKFAFTWALAVTSNGLKVDKNFELAERAYAYYKQNGKMPTDLQAGQAQIAINESLDLFNELIEKHGFEAVEKFMTTKTTVKEVEAFTGRKVSGENLTTEVYGAAALGPKIGNGFFANLYGHFEQLTMDRWLMRTWGRWTGTLVEENKANIKLKKDQLKQLIQSMTAEQKKAFEAIIKTKLAVGKLDMVAEAIWKASQKPANRTAMALIGAADETLQARFVEILGPLKKNQKRVSLGDELRKVGNSLTNYLDGQKEAPSGPPERARIRKVMSQVLDQMQAEYPALTMSDLQALLWYPEKRLYDAAKTADEGVAGYEDDEAPDYANAAASLAKQLGVSEEQINSAIQEVNDELQAAISAAAAERAAGGNVLRQAAPGEAYGAAEGVAATTGEANLTEQEQALVKAVQENGGVSLNGNGEAVSPTSGYVVAIRSLNVVGAENAVLSLRQFAQENESLLSHENVIVGMFDFGDGSGTVSLDLNLVVQDKDAAVRIGQALDQIAIWDIANSEAINTNGQGGAGLDLATAEMLLSEIEKGNYDVRLEELQARGQVSGGAIGETESVLRQPGRPGVEGIPGRGTDNQGVRARYGNPIANAVSAIGYHFSRQPRANLDGLFYGTGLKGAEGRRLQQTDDKRLSQRIHFYIDTGAGVKPEAGVGAYAHAVNLDNLYDIGADPLGFRAAAAANGIDQDNVWFNAVESAIIDAGFDGYVARNAQGTQGVAVLLGKHTVGVDQVAAPEAVRQATRTQAPGTPVFKKYLDQPTRGFIDPKSLTAILTKASDASTPGHEMIHAVIEIYTRIAMTENPPAEIVSDLEALLKAYGNGIDIQTWNAMSLEKQRPIHEAIAYNWEIYAFEGKAPSVELQSVFDRLSAWIRDIYASVRDKLNDLYKQEFGTDLPILTDEVRSIFDRMLASEEQIQEAEMVRNMTPLFLTQEESGMGDAEWAAYQQMAEEARNASISKMTTDNLRQMRWLSNARARILKEMQKKTAAMRTEVRDQVAKEVEQEPLYRVMRFLKTGEVLLPDGTVQTLVPPHKISTAGLEDLYMGEGDRYALFDWSQLPKSLYGEEGTHPDVLAEQFGFASGDEMVRALVEAKSFTEAVNERTDERMLAEHGELSNPREIELAVERALHNEARARFVAVELRNASRATQPVRLMLQAAKRAAKNLIGSKMIKDVKVGQFSIAEARANREAKNAMKSGDAAGVTAALQSALLNNQLTAEASSVIVEIQKGLEYLRKVTSDKNRQRIGADPADQIDELLSRFELKAITLKEMAERRSLVDWVLSQKEAGLEPDISPEMLDAAFRKSYKLMTVNEFRDLVDTVKQIEHLGRNEQMMLTAAKDTAYKAARDEIVASINENAQGRTAETRTAKTWAGKLQQSLKRFYAEHIKAAIIARILDGGKDGGPMWEYLIRPANEAADREVAMRAEATRDLTAILKPILDAGKLGGKGVMAPSIGRALNKQERIAIALNMGNAGNMQRLLDGEGWTIEQVIPILQSLTSTELEIVQKIWDYSETKYKPQIAAQWRRLYGKEPAWVEPQPLTVQAADGKTVNLKGGYFPIVYDTRSSQRAEDLYDAEQARVEMQGAFVSNTVKTSFAKGRVKAVKGRPLMLSLAGIYNGTNEVIHALAWQEFLIDANRLLRSHSIDQAIRTQYGPEFKNQLKAWVKDVAVGERAAQDSGADGVNFIRQSVSAAGLGFNIMSALQQVTGFSSSIVRVGAKYIGRGISQTIASPSNAIKMVYDKSTFMANRGRTQFRELNELRNMVEGETSVKRGMKAGTYMLMAQMQRMVDIPTWIGAYEKAIGEGHDEAKSIALADQAVIDSQGGGMVKDLSKIERGGPWQKLFTVFYSFMNTQLNLAVAQGMTAKSRAKLAADMVMIGMMPVVLSYALKQAFTPDGDNEWDWEKIARSLAAEQLSYLMGTFVILRELGSLGRIVTGAEGGGRSYTGPAGTRMISDIMNFGTQAAQGDMDTAFRKAAINLLGDFTGIPSAQINRTINGIEALVEGDTKNPAAVLLGFEK